ncbi:hypothetical protein QC761_403513 [Podospora bellae-mahoneyi]|uniref:Uncharacterized protein n=1 Tax=Podospora bellae-mahoneyi TaxID=2093777 RepID=A0ABR0FJL8_9PEZI|nr:hypothetical protein QC761_403513 [Podospora bellae-mahoneyi]
MGPKGAGRKTTPLPTPIWNFAKIASEVGESGNTTNSPLKYHSGGIDGVKYDLLSLKKGEVYSRDEFYNRVKAWYKAEIDRVFLLEDHKRAREENPGTRVCFGLSEPDGVDCLLPPRSSTDKVQAPTRVQPSRAAKRKVAPTTAAPATKKRATGRKKKEDQLQYFPLVGGDYELDSYDRERAIVRCDGFFKNTTDNDVSIFILRVSRYVASETALIHTSGYIRRQKAGNLRCALDSALKRKEYKLPKESEFQSAAVDWVDEDQWGPRLPPFPNAGKTYLVEELLEARKSTAGSPVPEAEMEIGPTLGKWPSSGETRGGSRRRKSVDLRLWCPTEEAGQAREKREKELKSNPKRAILEKLERDCTVSVGGLKFAIDLCESEMGSEDGARFVML